MPLPSSSSTQASKLSIHSPTWFKAGIWTYNDKDVQNSAKAITEASVGTRKGVIVLVTFMALLSIAGAHASRLTFGATSGFKGCMRSISTA